MREVIVKFREPTPNDNLNQWLYESFSSVIQFVRSNTNADNQFGLIITNIDKLEKRSIGIRIRRADQLNADVN